MSANWSPAQASAPVNLPAGVLWRQLPTKVASAAASIDLFEHGWQQSVEPVQWNFVASRPRTLRGVHVHVRHADYLTVVAGSMLLGLHDMRPGSPTHKQSVLVTLEAVQPCAIVIPPGVAHGFYFPEQSEHIYGVDRYWDLADELGCRWNDPDLHLAWPVQDPLLSPRDIAAPSYAELTRELAAAMEQAAR